jgi:hypothetical protein
MDQDHAKELHKIIEDYAVLRGYKTGNLLSFMTACIVETMHRKGYSDEFAQKSFEGMANRFKFLRERDINAIKMQPV